MRHSEEDRRKLAYIERELARFASGEREEAVDHLKDIRKDILRRGVSA